MKFIAVVCIVFAVDTVLAADSRPNILLIAVDDLRDTLGCYGNAAVKTPHIHLGGGRNESLQAKWMDLPKSWHSAQAFRATETGSRKLAGRSLTDDKLNWCHWGMMDGDDDDQPDGQIASAVITKIESLGDQPWIIGAGFMKPHDPFVAPRNYFDLYPDGSLKLYRDPADQTPAPPLAVGCGGYGEAFDKFTDVERLEFLRAYYACTSFMDAPGVQPGAARGLVEFVDLYPTIADLCGVTPPTGLAGQSLRPILVDPTLPGKPAAFTIVTRGMKQRGDSIRTDRWRYTEWSDGARELYDHDSDPEETRNVVAANAETAEALSQQLRSGKPPKAAATGGPR